MSASAATASVDLSAAMTTSHREVARLIRYFFDEDEKDPVPPLKLVFAMNLRRLMNEHDLKVKDLAQSIGVSASMVSEWRSAEYLPSDENIKKVCEYFGVWYTEMFRQDKDPNPPKNDAETVARLRSAYTILREIFEEEPPKKKRQ